jgi:GNAT superfamily N-acetyltransferase
MIQQNINLQLFTDADDINELTQLLNTAYKKWRDAGFNYLAATQTAHTTKKRIQNAQCFILKDKGLLIASVTYYKPLSKTNSEHHLYLQPGVATYGQLAVHPNFQNKGIADAIIKFIEQLAKNDKAERIIIDTAENNTQLVNYYINKGYKIIDKTNWSTTNYTSVFLNKYL